MTESEGNVSFRIRNVTEINETPRPVRIKEEPLESPQDEADTQLNETQLPEDVPVHTLNPSEIKEEPVRIKEEKSDPPITGPTLVGDPGPPTTSSDPIPVPSRRKRDCCPYGIKCYRQNASHREAEAHPGDNDYQLPDYPKPPPGTPQCPYGAQCYRRNPVHFQQFSHSGSPPPKRTVAKPPAAKKRRRQYSDEEESDDEDDGEMDSFLNDDSDEDLDPYADGSDEDGNYDPDEDELDASY